MVLNYTFMYRGYKTSYKTEILSRDKKSILLMLLFLELASPTPPPFPLLLKTFSALPSAGFVQTFFRFLAQETRFI